VPGVDVAFIEKHRFQLPLPEHRGALAP